MNQILKELDKTHLISKDEVMNTIFSLLKENDVKSNIIISFDTFGIKNNIENAIRGSILSIFDNNQMALYDNNYPMFGLSFSLCELALIFFHLKDLGFELYKNTYKGYDYFFLKSNIQGTEIIFNTQSLERFYKETNVGSGNGEKEIKLTTFPNKNTLLIVNEFNQ